MRMTICGIFVLFMFVSSPVLGQDIGWPPAQVAKTGAFSGFLGIEDDGVMQEGVAWPNPRFTANNDQNGDGDCSDLGETCNGTVTDNLTGLVWLRDAGCTGFYLGDSHGTNGRSLTDATMAAQLLSQGYCGLMDGSAQGDWRVPNIKELDSLVYFRYAGPALPNTSGTAQHTEGSPFFNLQPSDYWSSTVLSSSTGFIYWRQHFGQGVRLVSSYSESFHVWPVRNGAPIFADGFGPGSTQQWSSEAP